MILPIYGATVMDDNFPLGWAGLPGTHGMTPAPTTTAWNDPSADPIGDLRRYMDLAKEAVTVTKIEVNAGTLDALRAARSDAQRDNLIPGLIGLWWNVGVYVDAEVPNGKARVTWSDGRVEVVPDGAECPRCGAERVPWGDGLRCLRCGWEDDDADA